MVRFRVLFQSLIIADSLVILSVVFAALVEPRSQGLLPVAGGLAGLSTALQAWTIGGISTRLRAVLLVTGVVTIVAMILMAVAGTHA